MKDIQRIWESYLNKEDQGLPAGRVGHIHTDQPAGKAGNPWGDETRILEGVNCECKSCTHWVVGDKCKAESISIMKTENGQPVCATYSESNTSI